MKANLVPCGNGRGGAAWAGPRPAARLTASAGGVVVVPWAKDGADQSTRLSAAITTNDLISVSPFRERERELRPSQSNTSPAVGQGFRLR